MDTNEFHGYRGNVQQKIREDAINNKTQKNSDQVGFYGVLWVHLE